MSMPETDVAELIRNVNATNNAVEDQCLRTRGAADAAIRSARAAEGGRGRRGDGQGRAPDHPGRTPPTALALAAPGHLCGLVDRTRRRGLLLRG